MVNFLHECQAIPKEIEYCLIPGCLLWEDDSIPPILKERLDKAIDVYEHSPNMKFVLSGDGRKRISNDVNAMVQYLRTNSSIPEDKLIVHPGGYTTYDSVRYVKKNINCKNLLVLTSDFHIARVLYISKSMGLQACFIKTERMDRAKQKPMIIRERLAMAKAWFEVHFGKIEYGTKKSRIFFVATMIFGKLLFNLLRLTGHNATTYPGRRCIQICPDLFCHLTEHINLILVTGTNGKTTCCRLIEQALLSNNVTCFSNRSSANLRFGVATTLIEHCNIFGRYKEQYAILECDEGDFAKIAYQFKSKKVSILVTNLFPDQLDRYGDLMRVREYVLSGIENLPEAEVFLNGDCPYTASLTYKLPNRSYYYGLESFSSQVSSYPERITRCPICNGELFYKNKGYSHLGDYKCSACGYVRYKPEISYSIESGSEYPRYMVYNALATGSVLNSLRITLPIEYVLEMPFFNPGRYESIDIGSTTCVLTLVKNPVGFEQAISRLNYQMDAAVVIALGDQVCDGQDVSWIWECDMTKIANMSASGCPIYATGQRAYSMAVRLQYENVFVDHAHVKEESKSLLDKMIGKYSKIYIFATYSNMLEVREKLGSMTRLKALWER